jgi:hypothetical protein
MGKPQTAELLIGRIEQLLDRHAGETCASEGRRADDLQATVFSP